VRRRNARARAAPGAARWRVRDPDFAGWTPAERERRDGRTILRERLLRIANSGERKA